MLAVGGIFYALPPALKVGPDWLVLVVVVLLVTPGTFLHRRGLNLPAHIFGYAALGAVTLAMIASLALLVLRLPLHRETPAQLLRAAAALWSSNVLVFASWYWRLDAGGPHQRDLRGSHTDGAFLFPQMAHRRAGALALGQGIDDGAGGHCSGHSRGSRRACGQYSLKRDVNSGSTPVTA